MRLGKQVTMRCKNHAISEAQQCIIRKNRKFQNHLIHFRLTITAHAKDFILMRIQHGNDLLWCVFCRQIIARTVVQQISQKE